MSGERIRTAVWVLTHGRVDAQSWHDELAGFAGDQAAAAAAARRARRNRRITYASALVWIAGTAVLLAASSAPWEAWVLIGAALLVGDAIGTARRRWPR